MSYNNVAYLLKVRTVKPEKHKLLDNGCYTQQWSSWWKECCLCGSCRGYITGANCHYERVLRQQLEE
jgi:hypothetical protein